MKKLINALAALALAAGSVVVWAAPAQAAPGGSCSVEEWSNPGSWSDCAKRLSQSVEDKTGCVTAPAPNGPTAGMAGWFTSEPDSALRDGVQGPYSRYGVAGYGLDTYDLGCLGTVKHPELASMTWLANLEFQGASSIMGAANGLRENAYNPGATWSWSDGFLEDVTQATFKYVFHPVGALTIVLVGVFLIYRARAGQLNEAVKVSAWAIFTIVVVTAVAKWPVEAAHGADAISAKGLAVVHSVLGPAKQDIPADQCVLGGEACKDNRDTATRASDVAVGTILYKPWLRAVLGDDQSATAQKYGPALYDATSETWAEAARTDRDPTLRQQLIEDKARTWNEIAAKLRTEDPIAYEYLQGNHSIDRVSAGGIALGSAMTFSAFDMTASVVILFSFGIFRLAILALPVLGVVGLFYYTSAGMRRVGNMAVAAFFNICVFGAYAGIYLKAVDLTFRSDMPGWLKIVVIALIGAGSFWVLRPFRHLYRTATGRSRAADSVVVRGMAAAKQIRADNDAERELVDKSIAAAAAKGEVPVRPENRRWASSARTVASAGAPAVTAGVTRPPDGYIAAREAAITAAVRPESNRVDGAGTIVSAVVEAVGDHYTPKAYTPDAVPVADRPEK